MSDQPSIREVLEELKRQGEQAARDRATHTTRLRVNKRTHRIRFKRETEDEVEVVIEPLSTGAKGDEA